MTDKVLVAKWIEFGDMDLGSAKILFLHEQNYNPIICFHCQQAVEKYLKAMLISKEIEFRYSHDLFYLLNLLDETETIPDEWFTKAEILNDFAVKIRYPSGEELPDNNKVKQAIEIAEEFRRTIYSKISD